VFEGFAEHILPTRRGVIHARVGGSGPPVLLLHGYPQTHLMWHAVAGRLAERFTVVAADLPGYGRRSGRRRRPTTSRIPSARWPGISWRP
jgi:haloacetate dehalogenase